MKIKLLKKESIEVAKNEQLLIGYVREENYQVIYQFFPYNERKVQSQRGAIFDNR